MNNITSRKFFAVLLHIATFIFSVIVMIVVVRFLLSVYDYEQAQHEKHIRAVISSDGVQVVSAGKGE